jgi:hypothetical protein
MISMTCDQRAKPLVSLGEGFVSFPGALQPIAKSHSERQTQRFAGFLNAAGSK